MSIDPRMMKFALADRRRSGRTVTASLVLVAMLSVSGLAYGLIRAVAPEMLEPTEASTQAEPLEQVSITDRERAAQLAHRETIPSPPPSAADADGSQVRNTGTADGAGTKITAVLAALEARREEQAERAKDWTPGRSFTGGRSEQSTSRASAAPTGATASRLAGAEPGPPSTGPTGTACEPGYVEILGIPMNTAARDAGLLRGDKILEYNGAPVTGRLALEEAWSTQGLPSEVPILVVNRYTGQAETVYVAPGPLGASLPPRYNP